jgi:ABC-type branched-subunit amino acid transport system permease subunit
MVLLATAVIRSRLGRLLRAMSDAPVALTTGGTNVNLTRVLVFCISAFMAGLAGTLFAGLNQSVNGATFTFFTSLQWLAVFAIAGRAFRYAPIPTALLGGVAMAIAPSYFNNPTLLEYLPALFGVAALLNALLTDRVKGHRGRAQALAKQAERKRKRSPVTARIPVQATREALP